MLLKICGGIMNASPIATGIVLITGANKGIGFETARQLAGRGYHIVMGARNVEAGRSAAAKILETGGSAGFLEINVADSESVAKAADEFGRQFHRLDVLINNAGIFPDEGVTILTVSRRQMMETFQTNTFGALETTQAFLPYLRKARQARVINLSSGYGQIEGLSADVPSYCLSKLTLNGVTIMLNEALAPEGISVNAACPGWVRTDMGGANAPRSVEEGADTVVWLAAEAPSERSGKLFRDRREVGW